MSHITKEEYLSAFLDDEAGSFEQHRINDQLATDETMRDKLSSYAFIGEAMRNRSQVQATIATPTFLGGIQAAIAENENPESTFEDSNVVDLNEVKAKKKTSLPKQALGYAVAASVVAVAAISFQNYSNSPETEQQVADATAAKPVVQASMNTVMSTSETSSARVSKKAVAKNDYFVTTSFKAPDARTRGQMNKFVAHHLQYASSRTLMPRVRAVSYSTDF